MTEPTYPPPRGRALPCVRPSIGAQARRRDSARDLSLLIGGCFCDQFKARRCAELFGCRTARRDRRTQAQCGHRQMRPIRSPGGCVAAPKRQNANQCRQTRLGKQERAFSNHLKMIRFFVMAGLVPAMTNSLRSARFYWLHFESGSQDDGDGLSVPRRSKIIML